MFLAILLLTVLPLNARVVRVKDYIAEYKNAVGDLVRQRRILPENRAALLDRGEQEWAEATK